MPLVYRNDGLAVGWRKVPARLQLNVDVWQLYVNGKKVDETEMPKMHISTYSLAETFDVGRDYGTQVDPRYAGSPFPFKGALDRVKITLTD